MKRWYAIGPVATVDDPVEGSYQCAPDGCVGWIDTRPVTGEVASGFFAFDAKPTHLSETHTIIGDGTRLEEYYPALAERSAWASAYAVSVNSTDTLLEMLVALLTDQADPDGLERCRPLTVDHRGNYEIHLGGHSRIYRSKFRGEKDRLWPNLQLLWQAELLKTHAAEAKRGAKDPDVQAGKMLAELGRLHKCPAELLTPKELKGLKPRTPTTRYEDHFDYPNGEIAALVDWTLIYGSSNTGLIVDGKVNLLAHSQGKHYRYDPVLSSSNHQLTITSFEQLTKLHGPFLQVRMIAPDIVRTFYSAINRRSQVLIRKTIDAASTDLTTFSMVMPVPCTNTLRADGSTITAFVDGDEVCSATDTSIPSNFNAGFGGWTIGETIVLDDFVTSDLLAASIPPELLGMRAV